MTTTMLTAEQKIEELTKMLREANAEADRLRSKLKESEKKNRKLEAQVANGVTILAGALPLIERLTKQMLPLDLAELPQEQVRILKENLLQIGVDAEKMDKTVGLVSYFLNKQTESARRVRIGKLERQVEKDKKSLRKTVEDTIRSVKTNEAMLSDAFNVTNAAAGQEADNGTEDHAVAACAFIASKAVSMGEAEKDLAELAALVPGKKTLGRQVVLAKQDAPIIDHDPSCDYVCPRCGTSNWQLEIVLDSFLRTLTRCTSELYNSVTSRNGVYRCLKCGYHHLQVPESVGLSTTPQGTISQDIAIEVGVAMSRGIPCNRFENVLNVHNEQLGSDTLGRNAHRWMSEGPGKAMLSALTAELHSQSGCSCDETPFDILQQSCKSRKTIESSAKQAYICVQNSLPRAEKKVELYVRLESRSAESIVESFDDWKPRRLITDAYTAYLGWVRDIGCVHQVCLVHWRRKLLLAVKELRRQQPAKADLHAIGEQIRNHDPYRLLTSAASAIASIYHAETKEYRRREGETTKELLQRIHAGRQENARPLMDRIDVLINLLAPRYAKRKGDRYEKTFADSPVSDAVVYYLNARDQLRSFLNDPQLAPDTNISERTVRAVTVLRAASGFKQSQEFTDSMCGWFTLVQTAKANGIRDPIAWLKEYGEAYLQYCYDESLTYEADRGRPLRKLMHFVPAATRGFDVTPWLPWEWVKRQPQTR